MTYSKRKEERVLKILEESQTLKKAGYPEKASLLLAIGEKLGTEAPIPNDPNYDPNWLAEEALKWKLSPFQAVEAYVDFLVSEGKHTGQRRDFNSHSLEKMAFQISAVMLAKAPPPPLPPKLFRPNQRIQPNWSPEEILFSRCPRALHALLEDSLKLPENPTIPPVSPSLKQEKILPPVETLLKKVKFSPIQTCQTLSQKIEATPLWKLPSIFSQILSKGGPDLAYASALKFIHAQKPLQYHTGVVRNIKTSPNGKTVNFDFDLLPETPPYHQKDPQKTRRLKITTSHPRLVSQILEGQQLRQNKPIHLQTIDIRIKKTLQWKSLALNILSEKVEDLNHQEDKPLKCSKLWKVIQKSRKQHPINWEKVLPYIDPITLSRMTSNHSALNPKDLLALKQTQEITPNNVKPPNLTTNPIP